MPLIMSAQPWVALVPIGFAIVLAFAFLAWIIRKPVSTTTILIGCAIVILYTAVVVPNSVRQYHKNQKAIDAVRRVYEEYEARSKVHSGDNAPEQSDEPKSR